MMEADMPVDGISNNVLNRVLKPKLETALRSADRNGMRRDKLEGIMETILKFVPTQDQFNKIMYVVHYQKGTNDLYYKVGSVPELYQKEKKEKPEKKQSTKPHEPPTTNDGTFQDFDAVDEVKIKIGKVVTTIKKVLKVRVFLGVIVLFLLGANMLGYFK